MRPIYLDAQATTQLDQRVLAAMLPYFTEYFGNPGSVSHQYGWEAAVGVTQARATIAAAIQASPEEIIFTSGATEANNLAIKGVAEAQCDRGRHLITVATEHSAVLDPYRYLAKLGFEITILPVQPDGLLDLNVLEKAIRSDTILVSVMAANNEIGVLQPIADIGRICRKHSVLFHCDAAQAIGKLALDVQTLPIDLLSMTAHKVYGPKGIGALYVRRRDPRVTLIPQQHGGGQERGIRSGTLNPPLIVGFAEAITLALAERELETDRLMGLRDRLWTSISHLPGIQINGHSTQRLAGNLNVSVAGVDGAALMLGLRGTIALSSGSACSATEAAPSHVLRALGLGDDLARGSVRFGIGRFNTEEAIDRAAAKFVEVVSGLVATGQKA